MKRLGIVVLSAAFLLQMHVIDASADQVKQPVDPVQSAVESSQSTSEKGSTIEKNESEPTKKVDTVSDTDIQESKTTDADKTNANKTEVETDATTATVVDDSDKKEVSTSESKSSAKKDSSSSQKNNSIDKQTTTNKDNKVSKPQKDTTNTNTTKVTSNGSNDKKENVKKVVSIDRDVPFKYALLKSKVREYKSPSASAAIVKIGQIGDWIALKGIVVDGSKKYYLLSNNCYILVDNSVLQKLNDNCSNYYVHANYTHLIKAKKGFVLYSDANSKNKVRTVHKGDYVAVSGIYYTASGMPKLRFGDLYFTANRSFVETSKLPFKNALLKNKQNEYQSADKNSSVQKKGKKGDFLSLKGLYLGDNNVFLKVSYNYFIVADFNNLQKLSSNYEDYYVHKNYTGKIKVKKTFVLYSDINTKHRVNVIRKGSFIKITDMQYTSSGIPKLMMGKYYLTAKRTYVETSTSSKIFLNILTICQNPEYPTGCEAIATTMMLQGAGVDISKNQVVKEMPRTSTHDGNLGFIGDPSSESGWWIYPPAMLKVVKKHIDSGVNLTDCSFNAIKKKIDMGHTVVVWISGYGGPMTKINHAITITGYDKTKAYFNDPWTGKQLSMTIKQLHNYRKADSYRALGY